MYISEIIFGGLFIAGIIIWKKYNDPRFFWYLFPAGGLLVLSILQNLSEIYLLLSDDQWAIEFFIFTALRIIAGAAFLLITLKKSFK